VENPAQLKRFRQFVNSNQSDNLSYVVERGQRRPATAEDHAENIIEAVNV
jgi:nitrite reductase (NADH) large subunit